MEKLKVGVVGAGLISKLRHIPSYKKMNNIDLHAICDLNESLANNLASDFKIPQVYTDFSKMVSQEDLDIVNICVPPQIHAPLVIEALESGSHVIVEKPMALKTSDCDLMIKTAKKEDKKLCIVHNNIFHPPFIKAREVIDNGEIGDFIGMQILLSTPKKEILDMKDHWYHKLPGGMISETGPHLAYMSLQFLEKIKNVDIFAKNLMGYHWAPYDEFRIELEGKNGFSSVELSYTSNCHIAVINVLGTKARLTIDLGRMLLTKYDLKEQNYKNIGLSSISSVSQILKGMTSNFIGIMSNRRKIGTEIVLERFVDSIMKDSVVPVSGEDGRETTELMEVIIQKYHEKYFKG